MAKDDKDTGATKAPSRQAAEAWAEELNTPAWLFAAARQKHGWVQGRPLTRTEFERAIKAAEGEVIG